MPAAAVRDRDLDRGGRPGSGTFARVGSIALNAVLAAEVRLGDRVAVFGQGVIGLLATRLATLAGADVIAVDTVARRLETAREMGAVEVVDATTDGGAGAAIRAWSGGGVDSAIELSGSRPGPARGDPLGRRGRPRGGLGLLPGRSRAPAPRRGVPPQPRPYRGQPDLGDTGRARRAVGPAAPGPHVHGRRCGAGASTPVRWSPTSSRPPTWPAIFERLDARRPRHPPGGAPVPGSSGVRVTPDTAPRFPDDAAARSGVAILGCGTIARSAHLPAYEQYGVGVGRRLEPTPGPGRRGPGDVPLDRPRLRQRRGAPGRPGGPLRRHRHRTGGSARLDRGRGRGGQARAGAEAADSRPLPTSTRLPALLERAAAAGVRVAVNHNGRWAPPWRATTLLLREGVVGDVVGVTHLHDKPLPPLAGTPFDDVPHMLLTDYLLHWVDITRTWLADGGAGAVTSVQAVDSRVPGQPDEARNPWSATMSLATRSGATAVLRITGSNVSSDPGLPVLGARHRGHRCAAACSSTPTASSSTTAPDGPRSSCPGRGSSTASPPRWAS